MEQKQERTYAMFCHLGALAGLILPVPLANIIVPLILWLIKKEESPLICAEGKKSLNFQISTTIYAIAAGILIFVLIGFLLLPAVIIFSIVMVIIASVKISKGEEFKYPLTLQLIK